MTDANAEDWANTFYFCEANGKRVVGTCDYDPKKYWIVIRNCSNFTCLALDQNRYSHIVNMILVNEDVELLRPNLGKCILFYPH